MNKFALVFFLLLIVNFSQEDEINVNYENIYDLVVNVIKGLSANDEGLCANVFIKNKDTMLSVVRSVIEELKKGKGLMDVIGGYAIQLLGVENLLSDCRVFSLISSVKDLLSVEGIKAIGDRISEKADTLYDYFQKLKSAKGLDNKLVYVGKCLKIILDIYAQ